MRKLAPAAFLISGTLVFGGLFLSTPAYASDDEDESSSEVQQSTQIEKPEGLLPHPPKDKKRRELEEKYGKQGRLSLPPLVIRPKRDTDEFSVDESALEDDEDEDTDESSVETSDDGTKAATTNNGLTAPSTSKSGVTLESPLGSPVGAASARFIAINPATKAAVAGAAAGVMSGTPVFPEQNLPIDIKNVQVTRKTPADVFFQAAQFGLMAMAGGALVLGAMAVSRAIRRK